MHLLFFAVNADVSISRCNYAQLLAQQCWAAAAGLLDSEQAWLIKRPSLEAVRYHLLRFCGMYQGRLRRRQTSTAAVAAFSDVLHLPGLNGTVLRELSAPDLLRFASTSRACRAAASLSYVQLDLNCEAGLKAFRGLHRLGCLQQLQEADLTAVVSDAKAIGHLALLGTCSRLKKLWLGFEFDPNKLWWWDPYITIWTGVHAKDEAYRQADAVSLAELAFNMPIDVVRK